jgi:hypothetical protein
MHKAADCVVSLNAEQVMPTRHSIAPNNLLCSLDMTPYLSLIYCVRLFMSTSIYWVGNVRRKTFVMENTEGRRERVPTLCGLRHDPLGIYILFNILVEEFVSLK